MEITCEECGTRLNIPDQKIPVGQRISISCPRCKHRMTIGPRGEDGEISTGPGEVTSGGPRLGVNEEDYEFADDEAALDAFEEGVEMALVMGNNEAQSRMMREAVESLGYKCLEAKNTRDALGKLRLHQFAVVIVPDGFDGIDLDQSPVTHFLDHQPMSSRRRVYLVLVGADFRTMDPMTAFARSANLVVNESDLGRLAVILKKGVMENKRFYKVFMETLEEVGRM
ncbi:MAG: zinc-ribbon domain-containing protein [Deltaproteobacteria bacterium]|nr:zinc-ribbon domain-containing protein [Deltaproteobacteria bacterium]MBW1950231.1 zinc-ribbon domain-containing protein [Deltaproteobacteria bacterium]MBW2006835.1 zinc-ribbon domain-containing protein [Deltaproteobacteria bacterium]